MSNDKDAGAPALDPNMLKGNEIARAVMATGLRPDGFRVDFSNGTASVQGAVHSDEEKQKVLAAVRTVGGVASVTDNLKVGAAGGHGPTGAAGGTGSGGRTYTVKPGDTLSKIAKEYYGDASKYPRIFDANRNILSDPDKIQPGQVLTVPE